MKQTINILENEYWYGGVVDEGFQFPFHQTSQLKLDLLHNRYGNQIGSYLLSSKGRVIGHPEGFSLTVENGQMIFEQEVEIFENSESSKKTLRAAFQLAKSHYFPENGGKPPLEFFTKPQFNSWIEFIYNQNQAGLLEYAGKILENGYEPSILMIDDGWFKAYGTWDFDREKFPEPERFIKELHQMGFKVMLWICPFVSPDTENYRFLSGQKAFIFNADGTEAIRQWWNGYSAVLDMTNPSAIAWLDQSLQKLQEEYGVDGFKFDAGDAYFYREDDLTYGPSSPNEQCHLWSEYAAKYPYNELRTGFNNAGAPLVERLADKAHSWGRHGVADLIPAALTQGILGYAYGCPDMIGGGEYSSFLASSKNLDEELFIRYAQIAALMPMMQFSAAPWRVLSPGGAKICQQAAQLRQKFSGLLLELLDKTAKTGEPLIRYMAYDFPDEGLETVTSQFMLGDSLLVAPVLEKGQREKEVFLPRGTWKYLDGQVFEGKQIVTVPADLDCLPYFQKL